MQQVEKKYSCIVVRWVSAAVVSLAFVLFVARSFRPLVDLESAEVHGGNLIKEAGGDAKVCEEADEIFAQFGGASERFLSEVDLAKFPALAALGVNHVIIPGDPPRISIRVGSHLDGFFIEVYDKNSNSKQIEYSSTSKLYEGRIGVHR